MESHNVLERVALAAGAPASLGWLLRIVGEPAPTGSPAAPPTNLALVLDVSGSMRGEKLARVKQAAQWIVRNLRAQDRLAVVAFDSEVRVLVPGGPLRDPEGVLARIAGLRPGAMTNLSGGWTEGIAQVARALPAAGSNRVLLLTDGLANQGIVDPERLRALARSAHERRIATSTVGVGAQYDEDLLQAIAQEGGGSYYYVESAEGIAEAFREEFLELQEVIAQNVVVELLPSPGVKALRQLSTYPERREANERGYEFRLGDLSEGTYRSLGLELAVAPPAVQAELPLLSGTIRYFDVAAAEPVQRALSVRASIPVVPDPARAALLGPGARELCLLRLHRARLAATRVADQGRFDEARALLDQVLEGARRGPFAADAELRAVLRGLAEARDVFVRTPQEYGASSLSRKKMLYLTHVGSTPSRRYKARKGSA